MKLIAWRYDTHCNKTHAQIEYRGFTEWYWVSGVLPEREIIPTLAWIVERRADLVD